MIKRFLTTALLLAPLAGLVSCLFDAGSDSAQSEWLSDHGMPGQYQVRTLELPGLSPVSSSIGFDSVPVVQSYRAMLGGVPGIDQGLLLEFGFRDSTFLAKARNRLSALGKQGGIKLRLYTDSTFYAGIGASQLPLRDSLSLRFAWKLDTGRGSDYLDSVGEIEDSAWVESWRLRSLASDSADTSVTLSVTAARDSIQLPLPSALVSALYQVNDATHLQLQVRVLNSVRTLRVRGNSWNDYSIPLLRYTADTLARTVYIYRMAQQTRRTEACTGCLVLHGGIRESLLVEFNAAALLDSLRSLYGRSYPLGEDSMDIRQSVVMAEIAVPRLSDTAGSEMGYGVPVFASSLIDSLKGNGSYWQYSEGYKLDTNYIRTKGHPNLLFFPGDTLKVQITGALRRFLNTASAQPSRSFRVALRMGRPMLAPYDTYYYDHEDEDGNDIYIFADNSALTRYDFASSLAAGASVRLKLWLANTQETTP